MRTVAIIPTVAGLAVVLAACREHTPEPVPTEPAPEVRQLAALSQTDMGTREEREARAPYSPVWWPQDVGDIVSGQRSHDLELAGSWNGLSAVWIVELNMPDCLDEFTTSYWEWSGAQIRKWSAAAFGADIKETDAGASGPRILFLG